MESSVHRQELERVLGHELNADAVERLKFFWVAVGSSVFSFDNSHTTWQNTLRFFPKQCYDIPTLDVGGHSATGANGQAIFHLTDFVCLSGQYQLTVPVNVVATPVSTAPVFVTVSYQLINNSTDVEITAFTWDANGAPAASIPFDWRCRVA